MNANVAYIPSEEVAHVDCAIVGGPAGAVLALLLTRKGVEVALLEEHRDFNRDFRGDTIHPSVLEIMDELGLTDRLLQLPHAKISGVGEPINVSFKRLKTRFPYIMMLPQADFLDFIVGEAKNYPSFHLRMGARAERLIEEGGVVRGVRFRQDDEQRELRAALTVTRMGAFRKYANCSAGSQSRPRRRWMCSGSGCRAAPTMATRCLHGSRMGTCLSR